MVTHYHQKQILASTVIFLTIYGIVISLVLKNYLKVEVRNDYKK